eukprot:scaffold551725_cov24-Prasinocladus_malaysianus.AAC.1
MGWDGMEQNGLKRNATDWNELKLNWTGMEGMMDRHDGMEWDGMELKELVKSIGMEWNGRKYTH